MRIAFFTDTFFPQINGVSRTMERQIRYLKNKGHEVMVFAPEYGKGRMPEDIGDIVTLKSIKVFFYPECRLSMIDKFKIKKKVLEFNPSLIHIVTEFTMGFAGYMVGKDLKIPMVSTFHTDYDKYMDYYRVSGLKPLAWRYLRRIHNSCKVTFCPSVETKKMLQSKGIKHVKVLSNGVDIDLFNESKRDSDLRKSLGNEDKIMILYVGRIALEKDINILISAYEKIKPKYKDRISLVITGDGPYKEKYEKQFGDEIIFTGYKKGEDLAKVYASADFFAYPSTTETFGNVVIEAMACGLPVVAARQGGVMDSVKDGVNGILTEPKNPDSFAEGLIKLIENEDLRQEYARNALNYAKTKSWDMVLEDMYITLKDIVRETE